MSSVIGHTSMPKRDEAMKYLTRLGNGWTLRVALPRSKGETYIYGRFLDKDYGSKEASLVAAQKQRDNDAELIGADKNWVRQKKADAIKSDLITGLSEVRTVEHHKNGSVYERTYIVAYHPVKWRDTKKKFMYKDNPTRANSRTREVAIKCAEKVRKDWEKELGMVSQQLSD